MTRLLLLLFLTFLSGCATVQRPPEGAEARWEQRRHRLLALQEWGLTGRVAIRTELETWALSLRWRQHGSRFDVMLVAPFGQGSARLEGDDGEVTLRSSRLAGPVRADDPQRLLEETLGWEIPVDALRYWVRGLPAPGGSDELRLDEEGRMVHLLQGGWEVEVGRYVREGALSLPRRVFLSRAGDSVRLVVERWQVGGHGNE